MNSLDAHISAIEVNGSLTLVTATVKDLSLYSIVIETPATAAYLREGHAVKVLFKETEVIIGTGTISNISLQNRIPGTIRQIDKGRLISKLTLDTRVGDIVSVITTHAVDHLQLEKGKAVTAMVKTNEILLSE